MNISAIAIHRPVFTVMVTLALLVLGLEGFRRLGTDLFPDVNFPIVMVTVPYPGASPTEVESLVSRPIEDAVVSLNGIDRVRSFSREGTSQTMVLFNLGVDISEAATEVRERISQVRYQFPDETLEPIVQRFDVSAAPIMTYTVRGPQSLSELRRYADDEIRPALEQVAGVAAIEVRGGAEREIRVRLLRDRLDALGLSPAAVAQRLRMENLNVPAGHFDEGDREVSVRALGEFTNVDQIRNTIVSTAPDGSSVRLRDVASVDDDFAEIRNEIRVNGEEAVTFDIRKQSGKNTVEVAKGVQQRMAEMNKGLPAGMTTALVIDQSRIIGAQVTQVEHDILFGGLMAVLVILLFMMDLRSTLISAIALPTSVIGTFFVMYVLDFTLNMMTLLALSLAIGLLIDDAVVVRENIFKHLERGKPPKQAAIDGTKEVALAVFATTLTILAVFMPIAFVEGIVGQFFRQFGITISAAVVISLFVAFTLDPMLSSRFAKTLSDKADTFAWLKYPFEVFFRGVEQTYAAALHWAVRHKLIIGVLAIGSMFFMGFIAKLTGQEFVNAEDRGQFVLEAELPAGTSLSETAQLSAGVEQKLLQNPEIRIVYASIGDAGQSNKVKWRVVTTPKNERKIPLSEIKQAGRDATQGLPSKTRVSVTDPPFVEGAATEAPIMINVRGEEFNDIEKTARDIEKILTSTPGVGDIQVRYSAGRPELEVAIDRVRARDHGLSAAEISLALRTAVAGDESGKLRQNGDDIPIRVQLDEAFRGDAQSLEDLTLQTPKGPIKVADVANFHRADGPQVIERENRNRQITIWASPIGRPLGDLAQEFQPQIAKLKLAPRMSIVYDGQLKMMNENNQNMGIALLLGVIFIYIVLASQFESFIHPLTIMMTLPLALVGGILALFLTGNTLAMGALIGIVLLMGLVTKNAILLIDRAIVRVRDHGETPLQAILEAGPERLRPILMTSTAMVLGMMPTAIGKGEGSEFRSPMAVAVIGGVISSTLLSLVVVPVFYLAVENLKHWLATRGRKLLRLSAPASAALLCLLLLARPGFAQTLVPTTNPQPTSPQPATSQPSAPAEPPQGEASRTLEEKLRIMSTGNGLTSDVVVARALQNSNELQAKKLAIQAADWSVAQARATYYPQLILSARYTRFSHIDPITFGGGTIVTTDTATTGRRDIPAGEQLTAVNSPGFGFPIFPNQYALGATLNIPLSDYVLRLSNAAGAAKSAKYATELEEKTTRAAVARDARVAYYQWIRAQGTQIVATGALAQSQGHLADTQNSFAAGLSSKADVLRAQSQMKSTELFLERSKGDVLLSTERLRSLMQDFRTPRFEVGENIIADLGPGNWPSFEAAYSEALAQRAELQSLQALEQSARDEASLYRKANLPRLDAQANATYANPNPRYIPPVDDFHATWDAGVVLSWTPSAVFGAEAGAHVAEAKAAQLAAQHSALKEALRLEIQRALQSIKEGEFALLSTHDGLVAAEEGYRVRRELFRIGRATLVEVMDAEAELTRARLDAVNAHIDYRIARTELAHALGRKP